MIAVSHPTGNQFVRALLAALHDAQALDVFFTTIASASGRRHYELPRKNISTSPFRESLRLAAQWLKVDVLTAHETGWASTDAVYHALDRRVARWIKLHPGTAGVYCYEDGALETFRAAKRTGTGTFYELPIAYWETSRHLLIEEAGRLPEWEPTLFATRDSEEKLRRKSEELALADRIVCPSQFVCNSLPASVRQKCLVAEFGSPATHTHVRMHRNESRLRILFAGTLTQRKGLADLFAAMKILDRPDIELVVMGSPVAPMEFYRAQYDGFIYEPTRSHNAVLDLMCSCDLLALPSIVEGRALVQQEAMSCGLPLIVTANAGGEDLIEEGETGFLVPIRCPETLAEKIAWIADHRNLLPMMRDAAQKKAANYTWTAYADKILEAILP